MKRADKLVITACLEEIDCLLKIVKKPLTRRVFLDAKKWYNFKKEQMVKLGYKGKIKRIGKHILKEEVVEKAV